MNSEFQFIRHLKNQFSLKFAGDDCAVLPKSEVSDMLVTADLLIEDVDFRRDWSTPRDLGHKSLAVSLSDIAAMGGTPIFAALSLGVPKHLWNTGFLNDFYEGWHSLAQEHGVQLVGGDISSSPDKFVIDSILLGETPKNKAILRSGAKPGNAIFVSGTLGASAAGLKLLESIDRDSKRDEKAANFTNRQLRPSPQVELAKRLLGLGFVTSMIDISDGLSSDLTHICEASGVGALIDAAAIPLDSDIPHFFPDESEQMNFALNGGEDFELLFTVAPENIERLSHLRVTQIGTITGRTTIELTTGDKTEILEPRGFRHF